VTPLRDKPIDDVRDLLSRVGRIEAAGTKVTIYPDAEEFIERRLLLDRIEATVREIRKDPKEHPLRKTLLESELLPYQLDGIAFAVGAGRAILADDMGLGKTIQGIGVAEMLAREAHIGKVLVICPASLKAQWRSEIERFSRRDVQLVLGGAEERASQYDNECFFTICNYEQAIRDILPIERVPWDLIILDEGQRIKNWEAKTSQVVKGLRSPFALVLTGTPLENRIDDLFSVVEFIDDRRLGPAFRFFNRHRVVDEKGKVLGYQRLGELRERLKPILLRRTRSSILKDLPERTTEILRIAPTDEQLAVHDGQKRIIRSIVNKRFISEMDLLRLRKALLICRMAADSTFLVDKEPPGFSSKLEALDDLLGGLFAEDGRKTILFSEWTTMLNLIEPLAEKRDAPFVRLDGSVPQGKRQQIVRTFQKDPACRLFITTNAGSVGLNLQAADTVINVDLPWNPAVLEQRIARAHRMGQKRPVQVFVLVTENTIEENLLATLSAKQELALAALDVESVVDSVDLSTGVEELRRRLELLLGTKPAAAVAEREIARTTEEAQRLARGEEVALAGGQLLGAAMSFLDQLIPSPEGAGASPKLVDTVKQRLGECIERDENGRPTLRLTLPDAAALDRMAGTLARLLDIRA
jgi:SNF2 family DNA or RNA helicase